MNNFFKQLLLLKYQLTLAIALCLFIPSKSVSAQYFQLNSSRINKHSIHFKSIKNLIIVPLMINQKGPFNFLLDTGVGHLVILDTTLLENERLSQLKEVEVKGYGSGDFVTGYITTNITAVIGKATMNKIPTVVLKDDIFNLSSYLGIPIHGILGNYFFDSFTVKINYATEKITYIRPAHFKGSLWEKVPLTMIDQKPYLDAWVNSTVTGLIQTKLLIDCGASHALSLESLNKTNFPVPNPFLEANLGVGLNGLIYGKIARVNELQIGTFKMNNVLTSYPNFDAIGAKSSDINRNGNLGANILKKFNLIFDYNNSLLYLKKNETFNELLEHDMSGIEVVLYQDEYPRYFINRVESGSPAAIAEVLPGDEVLAINFKPVDTYSLEDIVNLFKSQNGQVIILELHRNDRVFAKLFSLKKRI